MSKRYTLRFTGPTAMDFTVTDKHGNPVRPFLVQPAIRGPLMVKVGRFDTPVSVYDLHTPSPNRRYRMVPKDRNYRIGVGVELIPATVEQLDREHRARQAVVGGKPGSLKLPTLRQIAKLLRTHNIKQVARQLGVSESTIAHISCGKAYWYIR